MTPERYQRARELFHQAAELDEAKRLDFLAAACPDDPALRAEVERLFAVEREPQRLPESAFGAGPVVPPRIGRYRIIRLIGEGGMGFVYEAEQDDPERMVALKVIRPGMVTPGMLRRFHREAHLLGQLRHPGIAQIYDAGSTDAGEPFFAMELVEGEPLLEYARSRGLNLRERLALIAAVADALHHAHQKAVIHRDLKPANILVEDTGQPKILDFGVARATNADIQAVTLQTDLGQLVGTVPYMSPEQASGDTARLDIRSDIYALGVITCELLTGRLPHDLAGKPLHEALRIIREDDPSRLGSIDRTLRGDVESIVARALASEKERRYQSAAEFAADIRRYLAEQPITARPASVLYQLRKFARRNRALTAGVSIAFLALSAATVVSLRELRLSRIAEAAAKRQGYRATIAAASAAIAAADPTSARRSLESADPAQRNWEWRHFAAAIDQSIALVDPGEPIAGAALGVDGREVITVCSSGEVSSRDAVLGTIHWSSRLGASDISDAVFSGDLARLAAILGPQRTSIGLWEAQTGRLVRKFTPLPWPFDYVAVSGNGQLVAASSSYGPTIVVWGGGSEEPLWQSSLHAIDALRFSRDGQTLAVSRQSILSLYEASTGRELRQIHTPNPSNGVDLSADMTRAVVGTQNKEVVLWDLASGEPEAVLRGHASSVRDVRFLGDDAALVSAAETIRLWNARSPAALATLMGHRGHIRRVDAEAAGSSVLSLGDDQTVRLWDTGGDDETAVLRGHESFVYGAAFSPDGRRLVSAAWDRTLRVWDAAGGELLGTLPGTQAFVTGTAWTPDGRILAVEFGGSAKMWDADTGRLLRQWSGDFGTVQSTLAMSLDGTRFACVRESSDQATAHVWNLPQGTELARLEYRSSSYTKGAFSADGRQIAITVKGGAVRVWDIAGGGVVHDLQGDGADFVGIAYSPDGTILAAGDRAGVIRLWDAASGREIASLTGHTSGVYALCFSPDGSRLASGSNDTTIRLWDVASRQQVAELRGHDGYVFSLAFSPDGTRLGSGSGDHTVRVWDTRPRHERVRARVQMRKLREEAIPVVERLRAQLGDWSAVAEALRADRDLSDLHREAALQAAFKASVDEPAAGRDWP